LSRKRIVANFPCTFDNTSDEAGSDRRAILMSEQELKEFMAAMKAERIKNASTKELSNF
jgi:hypothetical protein